MIDGPGCPSCGCRHATVVHRSRRFGKYKERRLCRHCGKNFSFTPPDSKDAVGRVPVLPFLTNSCPHCGESERVRIVSTERPMRRHKCDNCGKNWCTCQET